jgi:hypothetical protein
MDADRFDGLAKSFSPRRHELLGIFQPPLLLPAEPRGGCAGRSGGDDRSGVGGALLPEPSCNRPRCADRASRPSSRGFSSEGVDRAGCTGTWVRTLYVARLGNRGQSSPGLTAAGPRLGRVRKPADAVRLLAWKRVI